MPLLTPISPSTRKQTYVVSTQAAQTALAAKVGDFCVRTDLNATFILQTLPPSTYANWVQLPAPPAPVQSVNSHTGIVNLTTSDISEGTNKYYTDARVTSVALPLTGGNLTGNLTVAGDINMSGNRIREIDTVYFGDGGFGHNGGGWNVEISYHGSSFYVYGGGVDITNAGDLNANGATFNGTLTVLQPNSSSATIASFGFPNYGHLLITQVTSASYVQPTGTYLSTVDAYSVKRDNIFLGTDGTTTFGGDIIIEQGKVIKFTDPIGSPQTVLQIFSDGNTYLDAPVVGGYIIFRPNGTAGNAIRVNPDFSTDFYGEIRYSSATTSATGTNQTIWTIYNNASATGQYAAIHSQYSSTNPTCGSEIRFKNSYGLSNGGGFALAVLNDASTYDEVLDLNGHLLTATFASNYSVVVPTMTVNNGDLFFNKGSDQTIHFTAGGNNGIRFGGVCYFDVGYDYDTTASFHLRMAGNTVPALTIDYLGDVSLTSSLFLGGGTIDTDGGNYNNVGTLTFYAGGATIVGDGGGGLLFTVSSGSSFAIDSAGSTYFNGQALNFNGTCSLNAPLGVDTATLSFGSGSTCAFDGASGVVANTPITGTSLNAGALNITGALSDGTYACGSGSITITNGVITAIS